MSDREPTAEEFGITASYPLRALKFKRTSGTVHLTPTMRAYAPLFFSCLLSLKVSLLRSRNKRELISYDTARIAFAKARYIAQSGLGGAMFWELSLDQRPGPRGNEALVPLVAQQMGVPEWRENELDYPESSEFERADRQTLLH